MEYGIFTRGSLKENYHEFCVVSDLHIGCDSKNGKDSRNDYMFADDDSPMTGEAYTLIQFCKNIVTSGELGLFNDNRHTLVLLGDIINGEYGYTNCYYSKAFRMLLKSIKPWLYTGNILYVAGNHDRSAKFYSDVAGFPRRSVIETVEESTRRNKIFSKCGVMFEHGHKFDYLCTGKNLLGLMGDFASNIVATICSPNLEDLLRGREYYTDHSKDNQINHNMKSATIESMTNNDRRIANGALNLLSKQGRGINTIICGHTHQTPVEIIVDDSGRVLTYYNTGKFAKGDLLNVIVKKNKFDEWHACE